MFRKNFTSKFLILIYITFLIRLDRKGGIQDLPFDLETILMVLLGGVSIFLFAQMIGAITSKFRKVHAVCNILLVQLYMMFGIYHLRIRHEIDYSVMADNSDLALNLDSFMVVFNIFEDKDINAMLFVLGIMLFVEFKYKKISTWSWHKFSKIILPLQFLLYGSLIVFLPYTYDEIGIYLQSLIKYYSPKEEFDKSVLKDNKYPYVRQFNYQQKASPPDHVFILFVESFNGNFVDTKNEAGLEYTPYFNQLKKQGRFYKNFYGQSVQTARGQVATLCSIYPVTHLKIFTDYYENNYYCLPEILQDQGFETLFFKAYSDITFDNTGVFVSKNGFKHVHGMTSKFVSKDERKNFSWGWGIQDNIFYQKFFKYLDDLHAQNPKQRFFSSLTTVSNHQMFEGVPVEQRYMYKSPKNLREQFSNSLRVTDEYLKTFISELESRPYLKNSLVYILGDHSFPMGEHESFAAHVGFYNENFYIPLLVLRPGVINSEVITEARSQIDIAPTILDELGISSKSHFLGESLNENANRPFNLVQPYGGTFISTIKWPYKYVYDVKRKREMAFNLEVDPHEDLDIVDTLKQQPVFKDLQEENRKIFLNDYLVRNNLIFPN